ncbi:MAG: pentapeptide repeat-containing protein [Actinomycetota bacterium]|nr:pentapeptide repeat-containing protein [Actinomycetota bacterium]
MNGAGSGRPGVELFGIELSGAEPPGAELSGAELSGAELSGADESGAELSGAELSGAELSGADESGAELSGAELSGAELSGADEPGVDTVGVETSGTVVSVAKVSDRAAAANPAPPAAKPIVPAMMMAVRLPRRVRMLMSCCSLCEWPTGGESVSSQKARRSQREGLARRASFTRAVATPRLRGVATTR